MCVYIRKNIKCPLRITQSLSLSLSDLVSKSTRQTEAFAQRNPTAAGSDSCGWPRGRTWGHWSSEGQAGQARWQRAPLSGWGRKRRLTKDFFCSCSYAGFIVLLLHTSSVSSRFCLLSFFCSKTWQWKKKWRQFNVRVVSHCFISVSGTNTGNCFLALKINSSSWTYW